jgi:hypothetical protein
MPVIPTGFRSRLRSPPGPSIAAPLHNAVRLLIDAHEMEDGQHPQLISPYGGCAYVAAGLDGCRDFHPPCIYLPSFG